MPKKFVITAKGSATYGEESIPEPAPGQILCRALSVGLCGTDRLIYSGEMPTAQYPLTPCHEVSARVERDNSGRGLPHGTAVCVDPYKNCGKCHACRQNRTNCCKFNQTLGVQRDGILREYFVIDGERVHVIPASADPRLFILAEPLALALHIIDRAGPVKGRWCLVAGAGNVGKLVMRLLVKLGASVAACDVAPENVLEAQRIGAHLAFDASDPNAESRILEATNGDGVSVAFETAGQSKALELCIRAAAFAGRVVVVGHSKQTASILGSEIVFKELDILGSRNSQGQMARAVEMLAAEPAEWGKLISHRFAFERAEDAFRLIQSDKEFHAKIAIDFAE